MPVFMLKTIMPMYEYRRWLVYLKDMEQQPDVAELQMATLTSAVYNALGSKTKPKEFIIRKKQEEITPKNEVAQMRGIFSLLSTKKKD